MAHFITRHPGALDWAAAQGIAVDRRLGHLDIALIRPGDTVIGTLPVHLVAQISVFMSCAIPVTDNDLPHPPVGLPGIERIRLTDIIQLISLAKSD